MYEDDRLGIVRRNSVRRRAGRGIRAFGNDQQARATLQKPGAAKAPEVSEAALFSHPVATDEAALRTPAVTCANEKALRPTTTPVWLCLENNPAGLFSVAFSGRAPSRGVCLALALILMLLKQAAQQICPLSDFHSSACRQCDGGTSYRKKAQLEEKGAFGQVRHAGCPTR